MSETQSASVPDDGEAASPVRAAQAKRVSAGLAANPMVTRIGDHRLALFGRQSFLTEAECIRLIAMIDVDANPSSLFSGDANPLYRTSSSCHLNPWDAFVMEVTARISALVGIDSTHGETLQGQRYHVGEEYKAHCDWFPVQTRYWPAMREAGGQRVWTAMIYLNDVEEGGETQFVRLGFMIPPRRGTILIWSNVREDGSVNPDSLHAARPVIAGSKYIVTKWFRERPWTPKA